MAASAAFDRATGAVLLVIGIGAVWHAQGLEVAFAADPVGPKPFPTIVGALLAVCGATLLVRPRAAHWEAGAWLKVAAVAVASLVYPLLLIPLGFIAATSFLNLVLARALGGPWLKSIAGSIVIAVVIFALIDLLLGLQLPRGPLGG